MRDASAGADEASFDKGWFVTYLRLPDRRHIDSPQIGKILNCGEVVPNSTNQRLCPTRNVLIWQALEPQGNLSGL